MAKVCSVHLLWSQPFHWMGFSKQVMKRHIDYGMLRPWNNKENQVLNTFQLNYQLQTRITRDELATACLEGPPRQEYAKQAWNHTAWREYTTRPREAKDRSLACRAPYSLEVQLSSMKSVWAKISIISQPNLEKFCMLQAAGDRMPKSPRLVPSLSSKIQPWYFLDHVLKSIPLPAFRNP